MNRADKRKTQAEPVERPDVDAIEARFPYTAKVLNEYSPEVTLIVSNNIGLVPVMTVGDLKAIIAYIRHLEATR